MKNGQTTPLAAVVEKISMSLIDPFPNYPFYVFDDNEMIDNRYNTKKLYPNWRKLCMKKGSVEFICLAFVPDKTLSEKSQRIITIIFLFVALALFVGLIFGIVLLVETSGQSFWGWLLISLSIIYVVSGIILKIVYHIKK